MIPKTKPRKARNHEWRSESEARVAAALTGTGAVYEAVRFQYPSKVRTYLPDFILPNGIIIEVKGWFTPADRAKLKAVRAEHPDLDIRLVLDTPHQWTTKKKTMTNAQWCGINGFPWAEKTVPQAWIDEPRNVLSDRAIMLAGLPVIKRAA